MRILLFYFLLTAKAYSLFNSQSSVCVLSSAQSACNLSGEWELKTNTFPQAKEAVISLPYVGHAPLKTGEGFVLTKKFRLHNEAQDNDLGILLPRVLHHIEVYVNGIAVTNIGQNFQRPGVSNFGDLYQIRAELLSTENTLAIHIWNEPGLAGTSFIHISQAPFKLAFLSELVELRGNYFTTAVLLSCLLFIFSAFLFIHFLYYREKKHYLYATLISLFFAAHSTYLTGLFNQGGFRFLMYFCAYVPLAAYGPLFIRFLSTYLELQNDKLRIIADFVFITSLPIMIPLFSMGYSKYWVFYIQFIVPFHGITLSLIITLSLLQIRKSIQQGSPSARVLFAAFSVAQIFLLHLLIENMLRGISDDMRYISGFLVLFTFSLLIAYIRKAEQESKKLQRLLLSAERFVPRKILDKLGRSDILDVQINDHKEMEMAIMFVDIRDYSTLSEKMSPEDNFRFVNAFFAGMLPIINKNQGVVDKLIGDAIMALFDRPEHSMAAAKQMCTELERYNVEREKRGFGNIDIGIGLHFGKVILGTVGTENYMNATVISDAVNIAARLESLTKKSGAKVILSSDMLAAISDLQRPQYLPEIPVRYLGKTVVKGRVRPVGLYEYFGFEERVDIEYKMRYREHYALALVLAEEGEFDLANSSLESIPDVTSNDRVHKFISENIFSMGRTEQKIKNF